MPVDLHRDYSSLERPPRDLGPDRLLLLAWAKRRNVELDRRYRRGDYLQTGWKRWDDVRDLAALYGWRPAGTELDLPDWSGTYASNDGARVTAEDARGLASALAAALSDQDPGSLASRRLSLLPTELRARFDESTVARFVMRLLGEPGGRADLGRWIQFLKRGSFTIE